MDKGSISVEKFEELVRASERLAIVTNYVKKTNVICTSEMRKLLGIDEKECEE